MASADAQTAFGARSNRVDVLVQALVQGDRERSSRIFDSELALEAQIPRVYQGLLQPAMYRIGDLWEVGQITVATEHMATAITEELMNRVYPRLINPSRTGRKVVIATTEEEEHQVGAKMAADLFEMHGWDAVFPGAGLDTDELLALIEQEQPVLVGLSFTIAEHAASLLRMMQRIRGRFPRLPILVGGQGLGRVDATIWSELERVTCLSSLDALDAYIARLTSTGPDAGPGPDLAPAAGTTPIVDT